MWNINHLLPVLQKISNCSFRVVETLHCNFCNVETSNCTFRIVENLTKVNHLGCTIDRVLHDQGGKNCITIVLRMLHNSPSLRQNEAWSKCSL